MKIQNPFKRKNQAVRVSTYKMITEERNGYYAWNGNLYKSDIVRAAIRPKVRAIGKTIAKHIRNDAKGLKVNPEPYMRFLLEEPNPNMTMQQLLERTITQLELNNNAFIYIERDGNEYPTALYPIISNSVEVLQDKTGVLYYRFLMRNGNLATFKKQDIMHLAKDYLDDPLFGESNAEALTSLMEIVNTTDQGIVKAIKNSNVIRWLLKFTQTLRPEDIKKETKRFVDDFLSSESDTVGAAATDAKMDATQVEPKDFVPNEKQMDISRQRLLAYFNTNDEIIHSNYTEEKWVSYYEANIEPDIIQLSTIFTKHLFSRKERAFGNKIMFESSNLAFASLKTKMDFVNNGIDRGYVNANEGRDVFGLAPIEGGDEYVRRLDMAPTSETKTSTK